MTGSGRQTFSVSWSGLVLPGNWHFITNAWFSWSLRSTTARRG